MTKHIALYSFGYFKRTKAPGGEYFQAPQIKDQVRRLISLICSEDFQLERRFFDITRNRHTSFIDSPIFKKALDTAEREDLDLFLNLKVLLSITPRNKRKQALQRLMQISSVRIFDIDNRQYVDEMSPTMLPSMFSWIERQTDERSIAIKAGLTRRGYVHPPMSNWVRKTGNLVLSRQADQNAERHRAFIMGLIAKKPAGSQISPAEVARALNEDGRYTARGKPWSYNSTKNMLKRLQLSGTKYALPDSE